MPCAMGALLSPAGNRFHATLPPWGPCDRLPFHDVSQATGKRDALIFGDYLGLHPGEIVPGQGKVGQEVQGLCKRRHGLLIQTELG